MSDVQVPATPTNGSVLTERPAELYRRHFTQEGVDPFASCEWELRTAEIKSGSGEIVFHAENLEFPKHWSQNATNIVAEKYFRYVEQEDGTKIKENSVRQMISRVAGTITKWGAQFNYFLTENEAKIFHDELVFLLLDQRMAFNSPVWFNIGTKMGRLREEQASACFLNSLEDTMESILDLVKTEGMLYKGGSGSGVNYSKLRSSREKLSIGGVSSGPISFIQAHDAIAGSIKSGGAVRRAAKMAALNVDHGDILEFINCKSKSEKMAHALIDAGFDGDFRARFGAYQSVPFQNANHSVRVTDEFMKAVETDGDWNLMARDGITILETVKAKDLWNDICEAAWVCGDPGLMFDTQTNRMHTTPTHGRIEISNPCQPAFATMLTENGIKCFSDIEKDSVIWSGTRWTKVVKKWKTGIKPVYKFHTTAGSFIGTENHRVISNGEKIEVGTAESIDTAQGEYVGFNGHLLESLKQAIVDGLVLGDGFYKVSNNGADQYSLLCIGSNDQSYFQSEISEFINSKPFDQRCHRIKTTLTLLEVPKTYLRQIPDRYFYSDQKVVCAFLRGLYSANGSVVSQRVTLKAASFAIIDRVQQMLSLLGIRSYYTKNAEHDVEFENGIYTCKESYDLNISTDRNKFKTLIGFIQPYKIQKLNNICENTKIPYKEPKTTYDVINKIYLGDFEVFDITVDDEEHTYWTGGLLVSNCSEYVHLNDSACNLASLNLRKFQTSTGKLKVEDYLHAIDITISAMDMLVDGASYPTLKIQDNAHKFRQLGLGYTNLGSYLMVQGLPYDSVRARTQTAFLTAILGGRAYRRSTELAARVGAFEGFDVNRGAMLGVMQCHTDAINNFKSDSLDYYMREYAKLCWDDVLRLGKKHGFRNAQCTVMAPCGTISYLMDADTTGIEPDLSLVKVKKLVGGGKLKIVNQGVNLGLQALGYSEVDRKQICDYMIEHGSVVGSSINKEHLSVFDSSFPDPVGGRFIDSKAHVYMMAAIQPFISGALSKTTNCSNNVSPQDISDIYMLAWKEGLKSITVYRDGCKRSQPLQSAKSQQLPSPTKSTPELNRRKLPNERHSLTHKFTVNQNEGYIHAGMFEDNSLGEIFIKMSKEGSTVSGLMDTIATLTSVALQYGVPLEALVKKFKYASFEPSGWTENPDIRHASSLVDYIYRWLEKKFLNPTSIEVINQPVSPTEIVQEMKTKKISQEVGKLCPDCGHIAQRTGACTTCSNCGWNSGCG